MFFLLPRTSAPVLPYGDRLRRQFPPSCLYFFGKSLSTTSVFSARYRDTFKLSSVDVSSFSSTYNANQFLFYIDLHAKSKRTVVPSRSYGHHNHYHQRHQPTRVTRRRQSPSRSHQWKWHHATNDINYLEQCRRDGPWPHTNINIRTMNAGIYNNNLLVCHVAVLFCVITHYPSISTERLRIPFYILLSRVLFIWLLIYYPFYLFYFAT